MSDQPSKDERAMAKRWPNILSLLIFSAVMILFIGTVIYACKNYEEENLDVDDNNKIVTPVDRIGMSRWIIPLAFLSLILTALTFLIIHSMSRFLIIIGYILIWIIFLFIPYALIVLEKYIAFSIAIIVSPYFISINTYVIRRFRPQLMSAFIKESCRAVFAFPFAILLPIIMNAAVCFLINLTYLVWDYLLTMDSLPEIHDRILNMINYFGCIWLILSLFCFQFMVLCKLYATWFYATDKSAIGNKTILKCLSSVFRFHLGTTVRAVSPYAPFLIVFTMIRNLKYALREAPYNIIIMMTSWFTTLIELCSSAAGTSVIHSESFEKSADSVSKLYLRHPLRLLAIVQATLFIVMIITSIGVTIIHYSLHDAFFDDKMNYVEFLGNHVIRFVMTYIITIAPFVLILSSAVTTMAFCIFEDFDNNNGSHIKEELKSLMEIQ